MLTETMTEALKSAFSITMVNPKGGAGKTTLAANIGAICAELGQRVLLIDCDPQGSLSTCFPITVVAERGISHVLRTRAIDASCVSQITDELDILLELLRRYERDAPDSRHAATPCKVILNKYTETLNSQKSAAKLRDKLMHSLGRFTLAQTLIPQSAIHDQAGKKKTALHRIEPQRDGQLGPVSAALYALVAELVRIKQ